MIFFPSLNVLSTLMLMTPLIFQSSFWSPVWVQQGTLYCWSTCLPNWLLVILSLSRFGETFAVALDISKAFDRVCHKSLLSKLPSYGFYSSLCTFVSSLLSSRSVSSVVDGYRSKLKYINSGVPQGSVLSPTLFLLFINDLSITECPTYSYDDDSTLHYSITFKSRPSQTELHNVRVDATERLAPDLSIYIYIISD